MGLPTNFTELFRPEDVENFLQSIADRANYASNRVASQIPSQIPNVPGLVDQYYTKPMQAAGDWAGTQAMGAGSWLYGQLAPGLANAPLDPINAMGDAGGRYPKIFGGSSRRPAPIRRYPRLEAIARLAQLRANAKPNPLDAHLFAEGAEQGLQQRGPDPREWHRGTFSGGEYTNAGEVPLMEGQQSIDNHLAARFPAPRNVPAGWRGERSTDLAFGPSAAPILTRGDRQDAEQALTAASDASQRAGTYGTGGYAYQDNQIVDPRSLLRHDMTAAEALPLAQAMGALGRSAGDSYRIGPTRGQTAVLPDSVLSASQAEGTTGRNAFRSRVGRDYVALQQAAIKAMEQGVDPASVGQNVFRGSGAGSQPSEGELARRANVVDRFRGLRKQREDSLASFAKRRQQAAEARTQAEMVGGFRGAGLNSRDALAAALLGGQMGTGGAGGAGGADNDQRQMALDILYPDLADRRLRAQTANAQIRRDNAEAELLENPSYASSVKAQNDPSLTPEQREAHRQVVEQFERTRGRGAAIKADAASSGWSFKASPKDFLDVTGHPNARDMRTGNPVRINADTSSVSPRLAADRMAALVPQILQTKNAANIADMIAAQPGLLDDPQAMASLYRQISGHLPPSTIAKSLENLTKTGGPYGPGSKIRREEFSDLNWLSRKIGGVGEESEDEWRARQQQIKVLRRLMSIALGKSQ